MKTETKAMPMPEINKCGCEETPEMRVTHGGGTSYFGIYCQCGNNNRYYDSAIACIGVGIGNFPPMDKETAIKDWNEIYSKKSIAKAESNA